MPAIKGNAGSLPVKRKRASSDKRPIKRARSESDSEMEDSDDDGQSEILLLEAKIFESKKNYNNIPKLIQILRREIGNQGDEVVAAIALCRVFTRFMAARDMTEKKDAPENEVVVVRWLRKQYENYRQELVGLLSEEELAPTAFAICMRLLKSEGQYLRSSTEYNFPTAFLREIVYSLVKAGGTSSSIRSEFSEKFVEEYDDIRFYTLHALEQILKESFSQNDQSVVLDNALEILKAIESVPESQEELEDFYIPAPKKSAHQLYSLSKHKARAQGAWLALMKLAMNKDQRKSLLGMMSTSIAPWFLKPEMLMDFLTDSYDTGGSTSLLALSGVFYLIQEKNLDYPDFYKKLYSLLDSEILHSKHRSRFFRLIDTFLASTHLPANLVASFLKRLSRLTLSAPPAGVVAVVPWIYNILKKHPTCTFMIHRVTRDPQAKELLKNEGMDDPFLEDEEDPMETHAIESCLWEIVTLQTHYHPNVATLAKIISEQFTKHSYNLEDFLDHSYGSMLEAENSKEVKKTPVVEEIIPKKIYTKQEAGSELDDTLLVKLWDFN